MIVDLTNETINLIYSAADLPKEIDEGTITLVADTSSYAPASDFEDMVGNPVDSTNKEIIAPYPGGWLAFREQVLDVSEFTGLPRHWAIRQDDGNIQLDSQPDATYAGRIYTYAYRKRLSMTTAAATFPFSDTVVDMLVAPVAQAYSLDAKERFVSPIFQTMLAVAAHHLNPGSNVKKYGPRPVASGGGWPLDG